MKYGIWRLTRKCNLDCAYCGLVKSSPNKIDASEEKSVQRAVRNIIKLNPDTLTISGGEVTLVKDIENHIREISENTKAAIYIISNGTNPEALERLVPYVYHITISADAFDETNKRTRGIDGRKVLETVKAINKRIMECEGNRLLGVNSVVTKHNMGKLENMCKEIFKINPLIYLSFSPVMPVSNHLSVITNDEDLSKFDMKIKRLKKKYFVPRIPYETYLFNHYVYCKRGLNIYYIRDKGRIEKCWKCHRIYFLLSSFRKMIGKNGFLWFFGHSRKIISEVFMPKYVTCPKPCNCEFFLDSPSFRDSYLKKEYSSNRPGKIVTEF